MYVGEFETVGGRIKDRLQGRGCVLAFETAADYLGINSMADRPEYFVYSKEDLGMDGVECIVVDSYDDLDIEEVRGILCTSVKQTIYDLLRYDRDDQVIVESLADWYFSHGESYDGLNIPEDLVGVFDDYKQDAIDYYRY